MIRLMAPRLRKSALAIHIATSVGWMGAVAGFLALAVAGLVGRPAGVPAGIYAAMDIEARFVIVPLALAAVASGIIQSLGTSWGLLRHYWIVAKLLITTVATIVLLLQLAPIRELAAGAHPAEATEGHGPLVSLVVHSGGGLVVLLVPLLLSLYKPRGVTPYGWRKHQTSLAGR